MYVNLHTMMAIGNGTNQTLPYKHRTHLYIIIRHTADGIGSKER